MQAAAQKGARKRARADCQRLASSPVRLPRPHPTTTRTPNHSIIPPVQSQSIAMKSLPLQSARKQLHRAALALPPGLSLTLP